LKYAVIYQSKSGNTKMLAEHIFRELEMADKVICDLDAERAVPEADVYMVGFGVKNGGCSVYVIDCLDRISGGKVALFATCGLAPTEQYKAKLEHTLAPWLPEAAEYLGMFLCQGRVAEEHKSALEEQLPQWRQEVAQMLAAGDTHPDQTDLLQLSKFLRHIRDRAETRTIPII